MKVSTLIGESDLTVAAGEQVTCDVRVRNVSGVVDQFSIDVVGAAQSWATVEPGTVNLMPGSEVTVTVTFEPPRSPDVPAEIYPFGVRIRSREVPDASMVEEGHVEVQPFSQIDAELLPSKRRGRRKAKFKLAVENAGNAPARIEVDTFDPEDDQLDITLNREYFTLQPGTVALLNVKVKPFDRFFRGEPRTHAFELKVSESPQEGWIPSEPITVKGQMIQERMLPGWVIPLVAMMMVIIGLLTALWFMVVAPSIRTIASQQVEGKVSDASKAAEAANDAAAKAGQSADEAEANLSSAAAATSTPQPVPLDFRIAAFANPVADGSFQRFTFVAPEKKAMDISSIILQNPRSDSGVIRIAVGDKVLLEAGLANFNDTTYSYPNLLHVNPEQPVVMTVNCTKPGTGSARCTPSASFSAKLLPLAPPSSSVPPPPR